MYRLVAVLCALIALSSSLIGTFFAVSAQNTQPQPPAPTTLTLYAGQGSGVVAEEDFIGDPAYGGNGVRVALGTTVKWQVLSDEIHTVTFPAGDAVPDVFVQQPEGGDRPGMLNPQLFLPSIPSGPWDGTSFVHAELPTDLQELSITFGRVGHYDYLCLYHTRMTGTVEVVAAGSPGLTTQQRVEDQAVALDALRQGQAATIFATRNTATRVEGGRGSDLWFIRAGTDWRGENLDIQAFLPAEVTIGQGDTVVWYVDHLQPHTVTFKPAPDANQRADLFVLQSPDGTLLPPPAPGQPPPTDVLSALDDPATAPRLVFGPGARKTSNPIYDGRSLYSSGVIGEHPRISVPMDKVWALTFNTPGTFQYSCLLHENLGMTGTINVQPR